MARSGKTWRRSGFAGSHERAGVFASQQAQSEVTQRIRIRYRPDVTADMRVIHNGKVFNIVAPLPDNRGRELVLMCREVSCEQ